MAFMLAALLLLPEVAFASTYAGQALLEWARGMIIAPLCLLSIVVSIAIAVFRPDFVKAAVWVTVVSLFLFFVISNATTIIGYLQS